MSRGGGGGATAHICHPPAAVQNRPALFSSAFPAPRPPPPCQLPCDRSTSPHDTKAMWTSAEQSPRGALVRVITLSCESRKAGELCATGRRLVSISGRATAQTSHLHRNCPVPSTSLSSSLCARSPIEISSPSSAVFMPPFFFRSTRCNSALRSSESYSKDFSQATSGSGEEAACPVKSQSSSEFGSPAGTKDVQPVSYLSL